MPAVLLIAGTAVPALAQEKVSDAEALAIVRKHCIACHAEKPTHILPFERPPKNVALESLAQLKQHAASVYQQTVSRAMPLGNAAAKTEAERAALGRWIKALPSARPKRAT